MPAGPLAAGPAGTCSLFIDALGHGHLRARRCGAVAVSGTARAQPRPWLWQCDQIGNLDVQWRCYVRLLLAGHRRVRQSGGRAAAHRPPRAHGGNVARGHVPRPHARGRTPLRRGAPRHARAPDGLHPALERPDLLRRLRHGPRDVPRPADHHQRRTLCPRTVHAPADALSLVHVRSRDRPRADARLPRPPAPVGRRVPQARRAGARLRAGRFPRLLDLAARSGRDGPSRGGSLAALPLQRAPLVRAPVLVPLLRRGATGPIVDSAALDPRRLRGAASPPTLRLRQRARRCRFPRIR